MSGAAEVTLIAVVAVAAWSDLRTRKIPNWVTVPGVIAGIALQTFYGGIDGAFASLEGAVLGFGIFIAFYIAGGMGAGDVKLFSAVGALVGPQSLILVFVLTGILGGLSAAAAIAAHRKAIPYGAVIAAGTLMSLIAIH